VLNTELYKIFYYVAKYQNISKTAEILYLSQPAISKSIKKLEQLTDCILFTRSSKGVALTNEGEILYEYVKDAFQSIESGERILSKIRNLDEGVVKIGISNTLCKYYFLPILEKYHKKYPKVKIQVVNSPSPKTYSLLDDGKIDFGIITVPKLKLDYKYTELFNIHDIFVSSKKYVSNSNKMFVSSLKDLPIMLLEKENQTRMFMEEYFTQNNVSINPEIEIGSMDFLIEFARIGIGVACVIKEFVLDEIKKEALVELPITPAPEARSVGIVQKANIPISKAAKTFIDFVIESER
jgi:DNA-binding transcriptional LysR family regulator